MQQNSTKKRLEVICGSMFSGKSEELIRRIKRAEFAKLNVLAFKHSLDNRATIEHIHAHSGERIKAIAVDNPEDIKGLVYPQVQVVAIDEVQFFSPKIVEIVLDLIEDGKRVIVAGLDLDFRGLPFGPMPTLLAIADSVTKLAAVCMHCGADAHFTQRLVNGKPAKFLDPIILIGAQECYEARCRECYVIDYRVRPEVKTVS